MTLNQSAFKWPADSVRQNVRSAARVITEGPDVKNRRQMAGGRKSDLVKWKLASAFVLVVLAIIVVSQNTAMVETRILFVTVVMPRAILLGITLMIGIAIGLLGALMWGKRTGR